MLVPTGKRFQIDTADVKLINLANSSLFLSILISITVTNLMVKQYHNNGTQSKNSKEIAFLGCNSFYTLIKKMFLLSS